MFRITCSKCGRPVSGKIEGHPIIQAYVICPECEVASRENIWQRIARLFRPVRKTMVADIIRQVYENALTQGFELGRLYERSHATGTGVIMSAKVETELAKILQDKGVKL